MDSIEQALEPDDNTLVITMGCRLNAYESEVIRQNAAQLGLKNSIVVNTCAVTREAERQARQTIRRLRRDNPDATLIVTGCAAQLSPETYFEMDGVDRVIGNLEKLSSQFLDPAVTDGIHVTDIMAIRETAGHLAEGPILKGFGARARAFVQIQQGCDHRCTFCIIPFARGPNRSELPERIIGQVQDLVRDGYAEVVLTGVDISSYGMDNNEVPGLGGLCKTILDRVPGLKRLRLSSIDPAHVDDEIFELLADEARFMPHLHLSLQSASDLILKRMKRRHLVADVEKLVERARTVRPDVVFGADIIAGFPTETAEHHAETLTNLRKLNIVYMHVFPYSERPDTPAANMPLVEKAVAKGRAQDIRELADELRTSYFRSQLGRQVSVLIEQDNRGHTEHFAEVTMNRDAHPGCIMPARVSALVDGALVAEGL